MAFLDGAVHRYQTIKNILVLLSTVSSLMVAYLQ